MKPTYTPSLPLWLLLVVAIPAGIASLVAGAEPTFPVGSASVDITPDYPIRLSGYGGRRKASEGVEQRLHAKALALGSPSDGSLSLLLTVDNTGVPAWITEKVHGRVASSVSLPRERFTLCSSHTHTGPMLIGVLSNLFSVALTSEEMGTIARYSDELVEKLVAVSLEAIRDARPCELWWGQGRAVFAQNRRTRGGPVDHDLPVLAARTPGGQWRALFLNYACHCTTLGGDFNRHCGDWAGYAQEYLGQAFPGATTLVGIGCGADSDPQPRNALQPAKDHGREIAEGITRILKSPLARIHSLPQGSLERFNLAFDVLPTRAEWEKKAADTGIVGYHARLNLSRLDHGETLPTELPYSVQTWVFGEDLAMVFLPGEVVVDYALRIKRTFRHDRLWVNAYANDVPCYIPSRRVFDEGGYEGGGAMPYYDRPTRLARDTEDRIVSRVESQVPSRFRDPEAGKEMTPPKSPSEALKTLRTRPGLEVQLVASEPLVVDPVAIDFGADGRLWVAEMHDYPSGIDGHFKPGGRLTVLSDRDGDGRFDHSETLADDLPFPTGVMAWGKGALVCAAPDILYLEDSDGDGKADVRKVLYTGFATHNYQARVNSLRWGLDGWVYGAAGLFGGTIHSGRTGRDHPLSGRDFRIHPDDGAFETVSGLSQQGRVRDDFGNWFGCDNGAWIWHFPLPEHYLARNPSLNAGETRVYVPSEPDANEVFPISRTLERFNDPDNANRTTSACGVEIYRAGLLGPEFYGNSFTCEPVHNVVRRFRLQRQGSTFGGTKAPEEAQSEFLASTDNWFRPVEVRTGPDGALWVVDMYRFVIEHPRWISPERLAKLDPRAGDRQGRIYRVKPAGASVAAAGPDLTRRTSEEWVSVLGGDNGPMRDLAHRLLLDRQSPALVNAVRTVARDARSAAARVQALHLLSHWGSLDRELLLSALRDPEPAARAAALVLTEVQAEDSQVLDGVIRLADDPSGEVRYQAALSLGQFSQPAAGAALARLALAPSADMRMRTAVLSSAVRFLPDLLAAMLRLPPGAEGRDRWVADLVSAASRTADEPARAAILVQVMPGVNDPVTASHLEVAASLLTPAMRLDPGTPLGARAGRLLAYARQVAGDERAPVPLRVAGLALVGRAAALDTDLALYRVALRPDSDPALQRAALALLRHREGAKLGELLLSGWDQRSPGMREQILEALLDRDSGAEALLEALKSGILAARELAPTHRQRLLRHPSAAIARRAAGLLPAAAESNRAAIVKSYSGAADLHGDPDNGFRIFAANCTACHAFRGNGHAVGPDLGTYREKPVGEFLVAILDPSSVIEPRFLNYLVETRDGRSLSGVVQNESANGFTLVQGGGLSEPLLRSEVVRMQPGAFSLMPEGFEGVIPPQSMADLVAYLKSGSPRVFGGATPAECETARRDFFAIPGAGLTRIRSASELLPYRCWLGTWPLHHCRQTDGRSRVEWETVVPVSSAGGGEWVSFAAPAAMGHRSQPKGSFTLMVNDRKVLEFDVTLGDALWEGAGMPVRLIYRVKERNEEDSNGVLTLEVRRGAFRPGETLRWSVQGSAANSLRWFGLYAVPGP
jgi:putative membrane-bound dehydrogenase-like protein